MLQGRQGQVRGTVRDLLVGLGVLILIGCTGKSSSQRKSSTTDAGPSHKEEKVVEPSKPKSAPKKPKDPVKDAVKRFVDLVDHCDVWYFSHINPDSIDEWNPPVPLGRMESECNGLVRWVDEWGPKLILRNPSMTELVYNAYVLADLYRRFDYRSKNMSVRLKLPWKKRIAFFKERLRKVSRLIVSSYKSLQYKEESPAKNLRFFYKYLKDAHKVVLNEVFGPALKKKTIHFYRMKFYADMLRALDQSRDIPATSRKAVEEYLKVYEQLLPFFSSDFGDKIDKEGRKLKAALIRAARRFNRDFPRGMR